MKKIKQECNNQAETHGIDIAENIKAKKYISTYYIEQALVQ